MHKRRGMLGGGVLLLAAVFGPWVALFAGTSGGTQADVARIPTPIADRWVDVDGDGLSDRVAIVRIGDEYWANVWQSETAGPRLVETTRLETTCVPPLPSATVPAAPAVACAVKPPACVNC